MNFRYFGAFLSLSTVLGINLVATKALTQQPQKPSIQFNKAYSWKSGCKVDNQLAGEDGRTLAIVLDNMNVADNERKLCFIVVPTALPGNYLMQDVQVLYQGTTENPQGAKTLLKRKYIFVSKSRKKIRTKWVSKLFKSSNPLFQEQDEVSVIPKSCGWQGLLIIGIDARASRTTSLIVDTADLNAGDVKIDIDTTPCS